MDNIRDEMPRPIPESPTVVDTPARLITTGKLSGAPDYQRFDAVAINAAIDRQMALLPPGKTVAAVAYVDLNGANVAIVGKVPKIPGQAEWTVFATRPWHGDFTAGAALRWSL